MALQTSGAISLLDVQGEFGGSNPIGINEYYGVDTGVPTSGTISLNNFYGKTAFQPEVYTFSKGAYTVDGKLGSDAVFLPPSGLTDTQRLRSVGIKNFTQAPSGQYTIQTLCWYVSGFGANGWMPANCKPSQWSSSLATVKLVLSSNADWDDWWRYIRIYAGSSLMYQFDRLNILADEYLNDPNDSSLSLNAGQTLETTTYKVSPTSATHLTISNV